MKKILTLLALLIIIVLPACQATTEVAPSETYPLEELNESYPLEEPDQESPANDQITIDYAKNFTLEYKDGYKLLTVTLPWLGATEPLHYALVPMGTQLDAELDNAVVINTPIKSFVSLSSTYLPFLEQIGELESLIAVDTADYIYNAEVRSWVEDGKVETIGSGATVDVEKVVELSPDIIMTSASGSSEWDTHPVLEQAGLPVVINSDYLEQDPLGRAEWGKFIAAFYEKEVEADRIFDEMAARYEKAKASVACQTGKPTVFVNTAYEGTWYMPGSESYAAILLRDAGANYLWNDLEETGATPIDFEVVVERAKDADFWLNVGFASDLANLAAMDPRYADFKAYQEGKVFNNNARITDMGGTDYYESGIANPDTVLSDLIAIFYPDMADEHELFYYRQLQ
ncbi:MAG: ABC transporter substrate-binding protein [Anaerolineaceae bacterium]|jgi:iron complex transport system substrate-binding protein|nr:ABC transporter substrate-binding protein [Anaerolineaceae bacterium]